MDNHWKPSKQGALPLYQQIYEFIQKQIISGNWPVGYKLPPQRELADNFQVNRSTVVYALEELKADGWIESQVGRGTVVCQNTWSSLTAGSRADWKTYVQSGTHLPNIQMIQEINKAEFSPTIIRLGTGELSPSLLPTAMIQQAFAETAALSLSYPEGKGSFLLRKAVSDYLQKKGIGTTPNSIMIVSGAIQALQLISVGLLDQNSAILTESPSYLNSIMVFPSAGIRMVPLNGELSFSAISRAKRLHNTALLYTTPTFHNPTGYCMAETKRMELLEACAKERMPILEDDVYGDLWFDSPPPPPLKALDKHGNVLYVGSMSKVLGPGLRIGFIAAPEPVIERLADIKMQTDYGSSTLSQFAVAKLLTNGQYDMHIEKMRHELKVRRDFVQKLLSTYFADLAVWEQPAGGFYIWLSLIKEIPLQLLFKKALQHGILINPGTLYGNFNSHIRLSYSYASFEELEEGLITLATIIRNFRA
ncbi:PLP-dependent aminotransferase family protein [Niallia sp. BSM11]|uniref:aminotransferase-like domain-containing protein n=1 Tax=Niallia sp. BSM11 TaxID=3391576 RepID=UPI003985278F